MLFINKDIYIGEWRNNAVTGRGTMIHDVGEIHTGTFVNEALNGYGEIVHYDP
jgi:hypothetical protein